MSEFPGESPIGGAAAADLVANSDVTAMMENFQAKKSAASMISRLNSAASTPGSGLTPTGAVSAPVSLSSSVATPSQVMASSRIKSSSRSSQVTAKPQTGPASRAEPSTGR